MVASVRFTQGLLGESVVAATSCWAEDMCGSNSCGALTCYLRRYMLPVVQQDLPQHSLPSQRAFKAWRCQLAMQGTAAAAQASSSWNLGTVTVGRNVSGVLRCLRCFIAIQRPAGAAFQYYFDFVARGLRVCHCSCHSIAFYMGLVAWGVVGLQGVCVPCGGCLGSFCVWTDAGLHRGWCWLPKVHSLLALCWST
jgi:hypothetical protein